jgi:hypothetical protein
MTTLSRSEEKLELELLSAWNAVILSRSKTTAKLTISRKTKLGSLRLRLTKYRLQNNKCTNEVDSLAEFAC